jgi:hypothetical protein
MSNAATATVVDLHDFRARRAAARPQPRAPKMPAAALVPVPVMVVWVPVMPVRRC